MTYSLLVAGLKGALFLEALPRNMWPSRIFYYRVAGEHETAFQRLATVVGESALLVDPKHFKAPTDSKLTITVGWQYLIDVSDPLVVMHDSLLPRFRGFAPTVAALIRGESRLGVSAILADDDMDSGPILSQHSVEIDQSISVERAFELLANCYVNCLREVLEMGQKFESYGKTQDSTRATYSIWRDEDDFQVPWCRTAEEVVRLVRAVGYPYQGARSAIGNRALVVHSAEIANDLTFEIRQPGKVWRIRDPHSADVICGAGIVTVWANWLDDDRSGVFNRLRLRLGSREFWKNCSCP